MQKETPCFAGTEIVELGIQIEKNGRDFYNVLAVRTKSPKAGEIFKHLADEEEQHIEDFKKILHSVHRYEPKQSYPEEYFAYIRAMADGSVFTQKDKGKEIARKTTTDLQAIDLGITAEKDSIRFYEEMKKGLSEGDRRLIDTVITQEQIHMKKLQDLQEVLRYG